MFKKRKSKTKTKQNRQYRAETKNSKAPGPTDLTRLLLRALYLATGPTGISELQAMLDRADIPRKHVKDTLDELCRTNFANKDSKGLYQLAAKAPVYEGILSQHPRGFGFLGNNRKKDGSSDLKRDPFIGQGKMDDARHGDTILALVQRIRNDDRPEAAVITVLSQASDELYGTFMSRGKIGKVYPDDAGFPFVVSVPLPTDGLDGTAGSPKNGDIVKVKILRDTLSGREISGTLLEIVGDPESVDTQLTLISGKFNLPSQFSDATREEIEAINGNITPEDGREDMRGLCHVTIDGETAKDFDDAVCVEKTRNGYVLHVSIADVSHYVQPASAIDRDAYERGTSTYFPGRVIPMLPERLSNDLCSLVPNQDRYAVTATLTYDRSGDLLGTRFCRSLIKSHQRFTYTQVAGILIDKDPEMRRQFKPHLTHLQWMQELAGELLARKKQRGAVDFDIPEAEFSLDESGKVTGLKATERNFAHRIIEEFMLAANEAVATLFETKDLVAMYRVHEAPDNLKAQEFYSFAQTLGITLPPLANVPTWYTKVIEHCRNTKHEYIINNLILRTMQQAHYSADNIGHFGLALTNYTHFTSPIRRYPDLIVHRVLLNHLNTGYSGETRKTEEMEKKGIHLSSRERVAMNAEREIAERLKLQFMKHKIGERFSAVISGVTDSCLFVEIPTLCVSGAIDIVHLDDDYYLFDVKHHRLFGEISGTTYQIGDPVAVELTDVDLIRRRINFIPLEQDENPEEH